MPTIPRSPRPFRLPRRPGYGPVGDILESLTYLTQIAGPPYEGPVGVEVAAGTRQVYYGTDAPGFPWVAGGPFWDQETALPIPYYNTPFQKRELGAQAYSYPELTFPHSSPFSKRYGLWQIFSNPAHPLGSLLWHRASFAYQTASSAMPEIVQWPGDITYTSIWTTVPLNPWPRPIFEWAPSVYPHELPIGSPAPVAPPLNYPRPDPWSPESPDRGPHPGENPRPVPNPVPNPVPRPDPVPNPDPVTTPRVVVNPFPDAHLDTWLPAVSPSPRTNNNPRPRPPAKREKETKARMGAVAAAIWHGVGPITETVDFVDVLYEALPKNIKRDAYRDRGRQPNPFERAELIYRNINQIDIGKALSGYVQEQIEDYVIGKFGKKLGEASRNDQRPIGYGAGWAL